MKEEGLTIDPPSPPQYLFALFRDICIMCEFEILFFFKLDIVESTITTH